MGLLESMKKVDERRKRRLQRHTTRRNLSCLRVLRMNETEHEGESNEDDRQGKFSFEQIVGFRSLHDCEEMRLHLQEMIERAVESELDQLMIFAEDNPDASATKVGRVSGLLNGLVRRFQNAKAKGGQSNRKIVDSTSSDGDEPPPRPPRRVSKTVSELEGAAPARPKPIDSEGETTPPVRPPRNSLKGPSLPKRGSLHDLMRENMSESMEELAFGDGN